MYSEESQEAKSRSMDDVQMSSEKEPLDQRQRRRSKSTVSTRQELSFPAGSFAPYVPDVEMPQVVPTDIELMPLPSGSSAPLPPFGPQTSDTPFIASNLSPAILSQYYKNIMQIWNQQKMGSQANPPMIDVEILEALFKQLTCGEEDHKMDNSPEEMAVEPCYDPKM